MSGLTINVTYDPSVDGAPAGYKTGLAYAISEFESNFTNGATINIVAGYGVCIPMACPSRSAGR